MYYNQNKLKNDLEKNSHISNIDFNVNDKDELEITFDFYDEPSFFHCGLGKLTIEFTISNTGDFLHFDVIDYNRRAVLRAIELTSTELPDRDDYDSIMAYEAANHEAEEAMIDELFDFYYTNPTEACSQLYIEILNFKDYIYDNDINDTIHDFIFKINDSSKLAIQSDYDSIDDFFNDPINDDISSNTLTIIAVDTKESIITLEKTDVDNKTIFKFIMDITNDEGESFSIKANIKSKEHLSQLIEQTIDSLNNYTEFSKYIDDLENCL